MNRRLFLKVQRSLLVVHPGRYFLIILILFHENVLRGDLPVWTNYFMITSQFFWFFVLIYSKLYRNGGIKLVIYKKSKEMHNMLWTTGETSGHYPSKGVASASQVLGCFISRLLYFESLTYCISSQSATSDLVRLLLNLRTTFVNFFIDYLSSYATTQRIFLHDRSAYFITCTCSLSSVQASFSKMP